MSNGLIYVVDAHFIYKLENKIVMDLSTYVFYHFDADFDQCFRIRLDWIFGA